VIAIYFDGTILLLLQLFSLLHNANSRQTVKRGVQTWFGEIAWNGKEEGEEETKECRIQVDGRRTTPGKERHGEGISGGKQSKLGENVGDDVGSANSGPSDHRARSLLENYLQDLEKWRNRGMHFYAMTHIYLL